MYEGYLNKYVSETENKYIDKGFFPILRGIDCVTLYNNEEVVSIVYESGTKEETIIKESGGMKHICLTTWERNEENRKN